MGLADIDDGAPAAQCIGQDRPGFFGPGDEDAFFAGKVRLQGGGQVFGTVGAGDDVSLEAVSCQGLGRGTAGSRLSAA